VTGEHVLATVWTGRTGDGAYLPPTYVFMAFCTRAQQRAAGAAYHFCSNALAFSRALRLFSRRFLLCGTQGGEQAYRRVFTVAARLLHLWYANMKNSTSMHTRA